MRQGAISNPWLFEKVGGLVNNIYFSLIQLTALFLRLQ
jgi:hypothetical protein